MNEANRLRVLKFGGTSVGSAERIQSVASLIAERAPSEPLVVVVSAMAGVTNELVDAARRAAGGERVDAPVEALAERQRAVAGTVSLPNERAALLQQLDRWTADLHSLLHGVSLVRDCSPRVLDAILAHGELFAAALVAAALRASEVAAESCDARTLIVTDDTFGRAIVDREATHARLRAHAWAPELHVVTGFIAATANGTTTTLGRGGSDYTGTLIGAALEADAIEIWTDVDGVMSADPRLVPQAFPLPSLSYTELMELSHFGAKVVYPPSVGPAREARVPLVIRNTLNPSFPGTWVLPGERAQLPQAQARRNPVCGISSINQIALCRLEGAGMVGVAGIATRLFGALARAGISVILISQASSEHSICFALDPGAALAARKRVDAEFELERRAGAVDPLFIEEGFAVIAAVGEGMRETPGIAGRLFDVLGRNGINVRAIAQGSSELNISLVVPRADEERALRLIHDAFFFPRTRAVQVFVAGTGRVGAALLDQMAAQADRLGERMGLRLTIAGIARSQFAVLRPEGIPLGEWRHQVGRATDPTTSLLDAARQSPSAHRVFVDCTASADVADAYERLLQQGVAIVSANKIALSGTLERYEQLRAAALAGNGLYSETTVGAGLPVLRPIADLVATGDVIQRIDGVLSGTLSYLFGQVMQGVTFSSAVRNAFERGYTEPDPRDDLSGLDVARKLLILGREAGFAIEPHQVQRAGVLPGDWSQLTLDDFWQQLPSVDARFEELRRSAIERSATLCYIGSIDTSGAQVAVREIERTHPCASLSPGDNLIAVTSTRYRERPLIIRGPGAGPEVTAAGVFADILRASVEAR
ncbi:MAG: bifunctional aspartate kinase/homoserine dehydrogenase I [Longimicrobiales bacterium]